MDTDHVTAEKAPQYRLRLSSFEYRAAEPRAAGALLALSTFESVKP